MTPRAPWHRARFLAVAVFAFTAATATVVLDRMDTVAALALIAPGYLVQAWLFVRHEALGGLGYDVTIVGTSALFWTVLVVSVFVACRYVVRHFSRRRES